MDSVVTYQFPINPLPITYHSPPLPITSGYVLVIPILTRYTLNLESIIMAAIKNFWLDQSEQIRGLIGNSAAYVIEHETNGDIAIQCFDHHFARQLAREAINLGHTVAMPQSSLDGQLRHPLVQVTYRKLNTLH
mgnify:CR=1 FL=1